MAAAGRTQLARGGRHAGRRLRFDGKAVSAPGNGLDVFGFAAFVAERFAKDGNVAG